MIELKAGAKLPYFYNRLFLLRKFKLIEEYLNKQLERAFGWLVMLQAAGLFLIAKKPRKGTKICCKY